MMNSFNLLLTFGLFLMSISAGQSVFEAPATTSPPIPNNSISSHVLDISAGKPGEGIEIIASRLENDGVTWKVLATTRTDVNGRVPIVHPNDVLQDGIYKLHFNTKSYFDSQRQNTFYPYVEVIFEIPDATQHYHVPITLSNYGYSTYKGQ